MTTVAHSLIRESHGPFTGAGKEFTLPLLVVNRLDRDSTYFVHLLAFCSPSSGAFGYRNRPANFSYPSVILPYLSNLDS